MTEALKQRPFAVLENSPERKEREFEKAVPVYLRKLQVKTGSFTKTAELLGMSDTSISNGLRDNECRKVVELAAQGIYEREYSEKKNVKLTTCILQGELSHLKTIKDMIETLGGTFTWVGDLK